MPSQLQCDMSWKSRPYAMVVCRILEWERSRIQSDLLPGLMHNRPSGRCTESEKQDRADDRDIGHVDSLCPGVPRPSLGPSVPSSMPSSNPSSRQPSLGPSQFPPQTPSPQPPFPPNGFYPNGNRGVSQPVPGFTPRNNFRRKSSGTSTMTTTTTTTFDQNAHNQLNGRPQSMQPRSNVAFPMPSPAPGLQRAQTGRTIESDYTNTIPPSPNDSTDDRSRFTQSEIGHGDMTNRYSTGTMATFGRWDKDLRMAMAKGDGSSPVSLSSRTVAVDAELTYR